MSDIEKAKQQSVVSQKLLEDVGKFQLRLNKDPDKADVEINPIVGSESKPVKFIPIGAIEAKLDSIFSGLYSITIIDTKIVANEIVIIARIRYFHPIAQTWLERDGIGAAQIRFNKDVPITDLRGKLKTALQADAPHAYAEAIKNAAKKIGNVFGRNINRDDDFNRYQEFSDFLLELGDEEIASIKSDAEKCKTKAELKTLWNKYPEYQGIIEFKKLFLEIGKQLPNG